MVRNGRDPHVDLDDLLTRASCAFCARGGTCGGGVCSGEISVLRIQVSSVNEFGDSVLYIDF